ncbi:MAG: DUF294 nucleotidyltransferase-like domain-containing protein, partial [Pseudomonadales bacterium]
MTTGAGGARSSEKRFGGGPGELVESLRERLAAHNRYLADRYWSRHNEEDLIEARTEYFDELMREAWNALIPDKANSDLSLFAVGGYGRREQFPHSDVDLLIVVRRANVWSDQIRSFLHCLYDLNLDVGHSVRSLADCRREAQRDITVATSMYERRHLIGSEKLALKLDKVMDSARLWPPDKFFRAKRDEQLHRHEQFDNVEYGLEPNLKASPGGLRDLQTAMWVFQRQFNRLLLLTYASYT